nr:FTR1 family protein [Angustibacter aerolatus]
MLPTFVIGLREGLEASLIVGIVAAFLVSQGRRDALRQVGVGVGAAVVLCLGFGVVLALLEQSLPQRQQEQLETVVGVVALGMVTWMVLWMRRHSRGLKGELEGAARAALARNSTRALVVMAFLAVLREGFETAVFLVAVFTASTPRAGRQRRRARPGRGDRPRVRGLPRRRAHQPQPLLHRHRRGARRRRRRPAHDRRAHRPRGRLGERRPADRVRRQRAGVARHAAGRAGHRGARPAAAADGDRGGRVGGLRRRDAGGRALAEAPPPRPSTARARPRRRHLLTPRATAPPAALRRDHPCTAPASPSSRRSRSARSSCPPAGRTTRRPRVRRPAPPS